MAEHKESSVLFSLRDLMLLERDRIEEEERELEAVRKAESAKLEASSKTESTNQQGAEKGSRREPPSQFMAIRNEESVLFSLSQVLKRHDGHQELTKHPSTLRRILLDAFDHDMDTWRGRRTQAERVLFLPFQVEPWALGLSVALSFFVQTTALPERVKAAAQVGLTIFVSVLGAVMVAHRLIADPRGKKRDYAARLTKMIGYVGTLKVQLVATPDLSPAAMLETVRAAEIAHTLLQPNKSDP